ncbi:DUF3558 domain-containing protein [Nocardia sp. NBC_00565]|uniref:DUF3558 domain-containing protein n=1 Tax=Nocardia sp. NBC_00565 TaxID=2975993 RepID=UPI002E7FD7B1|nr:DUF3558 domain-containing protein [Nocardia sp. NBC_00565]WUC08339.1 DUF3558 domain-containing protein [Nocardia sp. NBC_00565]
MRKVAGAVLITGVLAAVPALTGCGSSVNGDARPSGSTSAATTNSGTSGLAADVPQGYKPCTEIPKSVLDSEKLHVGVIPNTVDTEASGGIKWRGCNWVRSNGFTVGITTTNLTVPFVVSRGYPDTREFTIAGRSAVSTRQVTERLSESCTVNVEMKGGSLDFLLNNPPSGRDTGSLDACELVRSVAEKVAATLPVGA